MAQKLIQHYFVNFSVQFYLFVFLRQGGFVFVCICLYVDYSKTTRKIGMERLDIIQRTGDYILVT